MRCPFEKFRFWDFRRVGSRERNQAEALILNRAPSKKHLFGVETGLHRGGRSRRIQCSIVESQPVPSDLVHVDRCVDGERSRWTELYRDTRSVLIWNFCRPSTAGRYVTRRWELRAT